MTLAPDLCLDDFKLQFVTYVKNIIFSPTKNFLMQGFPPPHPN